VGGKINVRAGTARAFTGLAMRGAATLGAGLRATTAFAVFAEFARFASGFSGFAFGFAVLRLTDSTGFRGGAFFAAAGFALARTGDFAFAPAFAFALAGCATERLAPFAASAAGRVLALEARTIAFFMGFFWFLGIPITRSKVPRLTPPVTEIQCANA
jgi:hypothetical protein